jgi:hypothetical protein
MKIIDTIMLRYSKLLSQEREVPQYLLKQISGVYLAAEDMERGLQLVIEGLQDEGEHIDGLLEAG